MPKYFAISFQDFSIVSSKTTDWKRPNSFGGGKSASLNETLAFFEKNT
jgi:hypothetical protein